MWERVDNMAQTSTTLSVRIDVRTKKQLEALAGP